MDLNFLLETLAFPEREYSSSVVNMLTNSLKFPDTTKTHFLEQTFFQSHKKIRQKYGYAYSSSDLDLVTS